MVNGMHVDLGIVQELCRGLKKVMLLLRSKIRDHFLGAKLSSGLCSSSFRWRHFFRCSLYHHSALTFYVGSWFFS